VPAFRTARRSGRDVPALDGVQPMLEEARREELMALAELTPLVRITTAVATGTPFLEIIRRVMVHGHDLVIVPPERAEGSLGLRTASTTMHLLRKCPVPVWVDKPEVLGRRDVLAAIGPFDDGGPSRLDRKLVELGSSLADRKRGRFHIVHAWELEGISLLRSRRLGLSDADIDAIEEERRATAHDGVAKLMAHIGAGPDDVTVHLERSQPMPAIVAAASAVQPSVVVMGTVARTGIAGLLIGNTAETTLGSLDAGILAVKPDGFVSPVQV
jgi:universal stress protein E